MDSKSCFIKKECMDTENLEIKEEYEEVDSKMIVGKEPKKKYNQSVKKAKKFIRNSDEFKSCEKYNNVKSCFEKYCSKFRYDNKLTFRQFSNVFHEELNLKLKKICRTCLIMWDEQHLVDIFKPKNNFHIHLGLMELAPIKVLKSEDNLPKLICKSCIDKLCASIEFRRLCIDSDQILRNGTLILNNVNETELDDNRDFDADFIPDSDLDDETKARPLRKKLKIKIKAEAVKESNDLNKSKLIEPNKDGIYRIKVHHEYDYQQNKLVNAIGKSQGPPCTCPKKCYSLISDEDKEKIFKHFWKIKKRNKQSSYLHDCLHSANVKQRKGLKGKNKYKMQPEDKQDGFRRAITIFYKVPVQNGMFWVKVCQTAFLNLHCLSIEKLRQIIKIKKKQISNSKIKVKENNEDEEEKVEYFSSDKSDDDDMAPNYQCKICKIKFNCLSTLSYHKKCKNHYTHEDRLKKDRVKKFRQNEAGQYLCPDCGAAFVEKKKLKYHRSKYHTNLKYTCEICGEIFNQYRAFHYHKEKHREHEPKRLNQSTIENKRKLYACGICAKTYITLDSLEKHKQVHFQESYFNEQQSHPINHHTSQFTCHFCGTVFHQPALLNDHILIHHASINYTNNLIPTKHFSI